MRSAGERIKRTRLIQTEKYVVAVEVEMVVPADDPSEPWSPNYGQQEPRKSAAAEPVQPLHPGPMINELAWLGFEEAYRRIEVPADRDALVRLQLSLQ